MDTIVAGLQAQLEANITGMKAYDYPPDSVSHFPVAVILPETLDPELCIGGNSYTGNLRVVVLVASGDDAVGYRALYEHMDPSSTSISIKGAVAVDRTLGGNADDAHVGDLENLGQRELWGGRYFAFDVVVEVVKSVA